MKNNQDPNGYTGTDYDIKAEVKAAFEMAREALIRDYMYMGTQTDPQHGFEYLMFKHIETREYIKIPKRG